MKYAEELRALKDRLTAANAAFKKERTSGKSGRNEARAALHAVRNFIDALDGFDGLATPLSALAYALTDLDRGVVSPLLLKLNKKGKPTSLTDDTFRFQVVSFTEQAIGAGMTFGEAHGLIRKAFKRCGYTVPGKKMVEAWRTHYRKRLPWSRDFARSVGEKLQQFTRADWEAAIELAITSPELRATQIRELTR